MADQNDPSDVLTAMPCETGDAAANAAHGSSGSGSGSGSEGTTSGTGFGFDLAPLFACAEFVNTEKSAQPTSFCSLLSAPAAFRHGSANKCEQWLL